MFGRRCKMTSPFIASIVDRFLCDNNFCNTRSIFRNEASFLFPNSSISNQVENGFFTLEKILDEYIVLKTEKAKMDQERELIMQEKNRVGLIMLRGIDSAMNIYNALQTPSSLNVAGVSNLTSSAGVMQNPCNTPSLVNTNVNIQNFPTHMNTNVSNKKRKDIDTLNGQPVTKKPRGRPPSKKNKVQDQNTQAQSSKASHEETIHSIPSVKGFAPIEGFTDKEKECKKDDVRTGFNSDESLDQYLSKEASFSTPEFENEDIDLSYWTDILFTDMPPEIQGE